MEKYAIKLKGTQDFWLSLFDLDAGERHAWRSKTNRTVFHSKKDALKSLKQARTIGGKPAREMTKHTVLVKIKPAARTEIQIVMRETRSNMNLLTIRKPNDLSNDQEAVAQHIRDAGFKTGDIVRITRVQKQ